MIYNEKNYSMKTINGLVVLMMFCLVGNISAQTNTDKKTSPQKKTMAGAKPKKIEIERKKDETTSTEKEKVSTEKKASKTPSEIKNDKIKTSSKENNSEKNGTKMKEIKRPVKAG